jgi:hypothetical protein
VLLTDVAPMVTIPTSETLAIRVGWVQLAHAQVRPDPGLDAQSALIRGGLVWAATDNLQLVVDGGTGEVFGFDGDGGKVPAQAGTGLRWVPGAALAIARCVPEQADPPCPPRRRLRRHALPPPPASAWLLRASRTRGTRPLRHRGGSWRGRR